ncbi:Xanthine dehydrogenase [Blattamonas nauphoetae]|uniref:Xanthine dehydrogenase n=1 Tax=Blattamonas nauphoetae TaxID=2049346 RepID=A0ABQ9X8K0_9EUKA|nr:Xanthine dehydrogenase [Blattamonas nauphoetae]
MTDIVFYLNGERTVVNKVEPNETLIQYLRRPEIGKLGTKKSCGTGICGACTVMFASIEKDENNINLIPVKSCSYPLIYCHGAMIWTVEGNNTPLKRTLNPIQETFLKEEAGQCGYCLPGMMMSFSTLFKQHEINKLAPPTVGDIEETLSGHTCRCTGYRPIFTALNELLKGDLSSLPEFDLSAFPTELKQERAKSLKAEGALWTMYKPTSLTELTSLVKEHPEAILLAGATNSTNLFKDYIARRTVISTVGIPELKTIKFENGKLKLGAAVTIQDLLKFSREYSEKNPNASSPLHVLSRLLPRMRTKQIRYVSTVAGELAGITTEIGALLISLGIEVHGFETQNGQQTAFTRTPLIQNCDQCNGTTKFETSARCGIRCGIPTLITSVELSVESTEASKVIFADTILTARRRDNITPLFFSTLLCTIDKTAGKFENAVFSFGEGRHTTDRELKLMNAKYNVPANTSKPVVITHVLNDFQTTLNGADGAAVLSAFLKGEGEQFNLDKIEGLIRTEVREVLKDNGALPAVTRPDLDSKPAPPTSHFVREYSIATIPITFHSFLNRAAHVIGGVKLNEEDIIAVSEMNEEKLQDYEFTAPESDTIMGKPFPNMHLKSHLTGHTEYTNDVSLPANGLYAAFILSKFAHGRIKNIDVSKALAVPGVVDYVVAKDIPGLNKHTGIVMDTKVFADEIVEAVHMPLGLILATSTEVATYAASLVEVDFEPLDAVLTVEEAVQKKHYLDQYRDRWVVMGTPEEIIAQVKANDERRKKGEAPIAIEGLDASSGEFGENGTDLHFVEGEAKCGGQDHYYAEMQNCVVIPRDDEVEVYSSTQNPSKVQFDVAGALGIPRSNVICRVMRVGGGYGGKQDRPCIFATAAAIGAHKTGRAIRFEVDRTTDMQVHGGRHPMWIKYQIALSKKTGMIAAFIGEVVSQGGYAHDVCGPVLFKTIFQLQSIYRMPHVKMIGRGAKTHHNPNTAFRGFGAPQSTFFIEMIMDHVADLVGKPPHILRDEIMQNVGDPNITGSLTSRAKGEKEPRIIWDSIMESSDYINRYAAVEEFNRTHKHLKRGIAITPMKNGACFEDDFMNQAQALIHVLPDGSVEVSHSGIEMGQGLNTKIAQVAAQALNIDIKHIHVFHTDTRTCANTQPTAASTGLDLNGGAVQLACKQINEQMKKVREENQGKSWPEICNSAYFQRYNMSAHAHFILPSVNWNWDRKDGYTAFYYCYGVSVSEVEIDTRTGEFTILRTDLIEDAGKPLNPTLDAGQVEGGYYMGLGWLTSEEIEYSTETGAMLTDQFTYAAPLNRETPRVFKTTLAKGLGCPENVGGSKTTAESPLLLAVSVLMALRHAINATRSDKGLPKLRYQMSPLTVERIKLACDGLIDKDDSIHYTTSI